ncbi:uncharacterized protein LOC117467508 isoform X2 [Xyrichtys novacula]|uniref:Uncharacterized protein LOC117467508 isoform X2 n=1 Tax=Xyrichtys novacula TaxID=13765 RepID=A0AAV1GVQ2_XYRNO|nr:uncharacterized protein LOC117467508 isoform X2 [Xyrichtys novacula]
MVDALSLLASTRNECGVNTANVFLFARPKSLSHYRGQECLRVHAEQCGAKHPKHLRSTQLRKHVATLSQVLNLKNNELDQVADFLGHDIRVHRDFYRLPVPTTQLAKISKLLLTMEKGHLSSIQGKSLDEIELDDEIQLSDGEARDSGSESDNSGTEETGLECGTGNPRDPVPESTVTEQVHDTGDLETGSVSSTVNETALPSEDLINIHCPENTQLTSKYLFLKELKPVEGHLQCHIYCPNCEYYIGDQDSEGQCVVCNTTWDKNVSLKNGNFFIYSPIQKQLEHLLQREDIAHCLKSRDGTCNSEIYEDIGSGKMYRNLKKIGGPLDCTHGYSLTLNCDGVPVFKSSLYGIWPLYGIVNELPYPVRKENVLLFGLWFGDKKPNVNSFLKPFTLECQKLSTVGFKIKRNSILEPCRVVAALMICDSVARPLLQNMTQFNGQYGCSLCLHPGEQVEKGHSTVRVYPYKGVPKRDHASTISDAREALHTKKSVRGVKGPTCLIKIPHFDIISGMPPDHMHNIHLGVVHQMASMWLVSDNHEKPYYIGNRVNELMNSSCLLSLLAISQECPDLFSKGSFGRLVNGRTGYCFIVSLYLKEFCPRYFTSTG